MAIESIVHARSEKRFTSLLDFCERIDTRLVNKRVVESFIKSGCFDSFGLKRSQLIKIADEVLEIAQLSQQDKANRQISLLDGTNQTAKKYPFGFRRIS